jgi:hypothetical protein
VRLTRASVGAIVKPVDADGTCLLKLVNYDKSATAADSLAADFDLEALTNSQSADLVLTATAADLVLAPGDTVYAELVNNSAAVDTNMTDGVITLEFDVL